MDFFKKYDILGKVMAVFAAILLWLYVISVQNPEITITKVVPLNVQGYSELAKNNLSVIGDITKNVTLELRGRRDRIALLSDTRGNDKITATLNLAPVTKAGEYKLTYTVNVDVDGVTVVQKNPYQINIAVDTIESREIPVEISVVGQLTEGFVLDKYTSSVDQITVTGPSKSLDAIAHVTAVADISKLSDTGSNQLEIKMFDGNDVEIQDKNITMSLFELSFSFTTRKVGQVPVEVNVIPTDAITADCIEVTTSVPGLTLKGEKEAMAQIQSIKLGDINLADALKENQLTYVFPIVLPSGVSLVEDIREVTVTISFKNVVQKVITIETANMPNIEGYEYEEQFIQVDAYVKEEYAPSITNGMVFAQLVNGEFTGEGEDGLKQELRIVSPEYPIGVLGRYYVNLKPIAQEPVEEPVIE